MFNKNIDEAKQLFMAYHGSHFFMERGGEYNKYKKYFISKKQELDWIAEYQQEQLIKAKNSEISIYGLMNLCSTISQYYCLDTAKELLNILEDQEEFTDTFSLLLVAESVYNLAANLESKNRKKQNNKETVNALKSFSVNLLNRLLTQPITVADIFYESTHLDDTLESKRILERINDDLKSLNKMA